MSSDAPKYAVATVVDDAFLPGAVVMLQSLHRTNPWFEGRIVIFCDDSLSNSSRAVLDAMFDRIEFEAIRKSLTDRIETLAAANPLYRTGNARFHYLEAFSLRGYDKVLVSDSDILFTGDISELFRIEAPLIAARDGAGYAGQGRHRKTFQRVEATADTLNNSFNCGFLLISSELLTDEHDRNLREQVNPETWQEVTTGSTDQFLYNNYFEGQVHLVSARYNYVLRHRDLIRKFEGTEIGDARVLHFNLPIRPWDLHATLTAEFDQLEILRAYELWAEEYRWMLNARQEKGSLADMRLYHGAKQDMEALVKTHLFIISPNNSGSTFLKNVMVTCARTWNLRREGQYTFGFRGPTPASLGLPLLWASDPKIREGLTKPDAYDWDASRKAWYFQAYSRTPDADIFVEKSPPFVLHVDQLTENFRNPRFIFLVRDPFATAEGILRRYAGKFPTREEAIRNIAKHLLECLRIQKDNIERHRDNSIWFTYEEMCEDPDGIGSRIREFMPELEDLRLDRRVEVKGLYDEPLRNMNADQIARLTGEDLELLTELYSSEEDLLSWFGYRAESVCA